ncbi:MAG: MotA/TolQ/ExbB proton channel family protein [Sneathiellaceae bacterium]
MAEYEEAGAGAADEEAEPRFRGLDMATVLGLTGAVFLIVTAIVLSGSPGSFIDIPAIMIVILGTYAITMVSFSARDVFAAQRVIAQAFFRRLEQPSEMTLMMLRLSDKARRDSPLSLQSILDQLDEEEYLFQALQMVVDTVPPDEIERVLRREMNSINQRTMKSVAVLRRASDVAPAMGLIGTLVGLVQMLGNLSTPEAIGPGMAVALLTTFYGAIMANVFFAPIASKLERNSEELMLLHNIVLIAAVSISRQENPRRLETLLNTLLPPADRVSLYG